MEGGWGGGVDERATTFGIHEWVHEFPEEPWLGCTALCRVASSESLTIHGDPSRSICELARLTSAASLPRGTPPHTHLAFGQVGTPWETRFPFPLVIFVGFHGAPSFPLSRIAG